MHQECLFDPKKKKPYCGCKGGYPAQYNTTAIDEEFFYEDTEGECLRYNQSEALFVLEVGAAAVDFISETLNVTLEEACTYFTDEDEGEADPSKRVELPLDIKP